MNKKVFILLITLTLFLTGCQNNKTIEKMYIDTDLYNSNEYIKVDKDTINKKDNSTYILFTYNNFCTMEIACDKIFDQFMKKNNIAIYSIPYEEFKDTYLHNSIKFAPSVIIVKNKKIIAYLDADKDEDYIRYQDVEEFSKWISKYIYLEPKESYQK